MCDVSAYASESINCPNTPASSQCDERVAREQPENNVVLLHANLVSSAASPLFEPEFGLKVSGNGTHAGFMVNLWISLNERAEFMLKVSRL
jgi:hypothetical protein